MPCSRTVLRIQPWSRRPRTTSDGQCVLADLYGRKHALCSPRPVRRASAVSGAPGPVAAVASPPEIAASTSSVRRSFEHRARRIAGHRDADGVRSSRFANPTPKGCVFEYVYLATSGQHVGADRARRPRRHRSAPGHRDACGEADLVIGVPESAPPRPSATHKSPSSFRPGPDEERLCGPDVHPTPRRRSASSVSDSKLNPLKEVICGRLIGRRPDRAGNTQRADLGCSGRQGGSRSTCASPRRPSSGRASTASILPRRPNDRQRRAGRGRNARCRPQRHRCRQPGIHLSAGHDRRHRAAGQPPNAAHASTAITRSNCQRNGAQQERSSSNTCWQPPRAHYQSCPLSKRMAGNASSGRQRNNVSALRRP